jgi:hypothetical protein
MEAPTLAPVSLPAPGLSALGESSSVEPACCLARAPKALGQVLAELEPAGACAGRGQGRVTPAARSAAESDHTSSTS